jgi:succinate-acetate transporter protein
VSSIRHQQESNGRELREEGSQAVSRAWDGIPARIFLQPVAAPSVLGLFGFAGATFMVAANLAGWFGNTTTAPLFLFPFVAIFGGVAQFAAGLWAYRARDALATAMHGTWRSFWIAYGLFWWLVANHTITPPAGSTFVPLGYWFIVLAAVTLSGTLASVAEGGALFSVLGTLSAGSILLAIAYLIGSSTLIAWGGWVLVVSAVLAWYTATAMLLAASTGRTVLPLFRWSRAANVPGRSPFVPVQYAQGEPGVKMGQ